jgi:hypothetical protein
MAENKPVKRKSTKPTPGSTLPISLPELRASILEASGLSVSELGQMVRRSIEVITEALEAQHEQAITFKGEITDVHRTRDFNTALKAINTLSELIGIGASKSTIQAHQYNQQIVVKLNAPFIDSITGEQNTYEVKGEVRNANE